LGRWCRLPELAGTVAAELVSSVLMRRCGYRVVLAAGAALLGLPSVVLLAHGSLTVIVITSVIRASASASAQSSWAR
jgi:hypothetical protein